MTRIYQNQPLHPNEIITLDKAASHHLIRVLHHQINDEVTLFNGSGGEYGGKILAIEKNATKIQLLDFHDVERESPLLIHLGQGIARGEKMDLIIQKAVELGVNKITPIFTEFCNVKLDQTRLDKKLQHWEQIIISACEQCGRNRIPELGDAMSSHEWFKQQTAQLKIILHPHLQASSTFPTQVQSICVTVGSEGGFSNGELKIAAEHHFLTMPLGPRILRTETAGLAAITALQTKYGDFKVELY